VSDVDTTPAKTEPEKKGFQFPSTMTVLIIVTFLVWIAAFLIPSGTYQHDENGVPQPGSFQEIDSPQDFGDRVGDFFLAPVRPLRHPGPGDGVRATVRRREAVRGSRRVRLRARDRSVHDDGVGHGRARRRDRETRVRRTPCAGVRGSWSSP
jgi:hypothetical protein